MSAQLTSMTMGLMFVANIYVVLEVDRQRYSFSLTSVYFVETLKTEQIKIFSRV